MPPSVCTMDVGSLALGPLLFLIVAKASAELNQAITLTDFIKFQSKCLLLSSGTPPAQSMNSG